MAQLFGQNGKMQKKNKVKKKTFCLTWKSNRGHLTSLTRKGHVIFNTRIDRYINLHFS